MSSINKLNQMPVQAEQKQAQDPRAQQMDGKFREVAELYERQFIRQMMKEMRSTVSEGGFIKQNNAEKIFRDQLDDQYAEQWSKSGGLGFANIIYEQLLNKYGSQFGLKEQVAKPVGPLPLNARTHYVGTTSPAQAPSADVNSLDAAAEKAKSTKNPVTFQFRTAEHESQPLTSPWAGVLLDKKFLEMDRIQYRIKHDNGLESLILTRGTGLGPEQKLSLGDTIQAGQQIGWVAEASPLFWTVKPIVSE